MGQDKFKNIILQFNNNWKYKDFALGFNFASRGTEYYNDKPTKREYYGCFHIGFWQLFVGFKI